MFWLKEVHTTTPSDLNNSKIIHYITVYVEKQKHSITTHLVWDMKWFDNIPQMFTYNFSLHELDALTMSWGEVPVYCCHANMILQIQLQIIL